MFISTYIWNLETYLQGSSGDADIENRLVDPGGKERVGQIESSIETYTLPYVKLDSCMMQGAQIPCSVAT